jgi:hypothetical protein
MNKKTRSRSSWMLVMVSIVLICWVFVCLNSAEAQTGNNAVYNSSGNCSVSSPCASSPAFIDASVFVSKAANLCGVLNYTLDPSHGIIPSFGAVIDARGLNSGNTSMTCTSTNPSPWAGITSPPPSTILLPATTTSAPIVIPSKWTLPPNTHLIGEGDNISSSTTISTTIQASSSFSASANMIEFGSSSVCPSGGCTGISVEDLTLDGQAQSINGISNTSSEDSSYVNHVRLYQILGTGLSVSGNASNSGPYSNITFDIGSNSGNSSTVCASINGLSGTRGIHGLTCISGNNDPPAAVLLDSSNNSIEDVRIVGFYDGIRVGTSANAKSNVLRNIIGDTSASGLTPIIVVHITSLGHAVSDLSVMGANNAGGSSSTITIQDDVTGAKLTDTSVGIYALGNAGSGTYYSRFSTSPSLASWIVGPSKPQGTCTEGSLYSCIGNSSLNGMACNNGGSTYYALWACAYNTSGSVVWQPVL